MNLAIALGGLITFTIIVIIVGLYYLQPAEVPSSEIPLWSPGPDDAVSKPPPSPGELPSTDVPVTEETPIGSDVPVYKLPTVSDTNGASEVGSTPVPTDEEPVKEEEPPLKDKHARIYKNKEYGGDYQDLTYGMYDLDIGYANEISSVRMPSDVSVAIFNKKACDPSYWSYLLEKDTDLSTLGDKYNNNTACVIVLPRGVMNGMHLKCSGKIYKIENYRKRLYPSDAVYISWKSPSTVSVGCEVIDKIPDGQPMPLNPDYIPPLKNGMARLFKNNQYSGGYTDIGMGLNELDGLTTNAGAGISNDVSSIQLAPDVYLGLFNKKGCDPSYWSLLVPKDTPSLDAVGSKYNNNGACAIVLPKDAVNGTVFTFNNVKYKLDNYRKRKFPSEIIYKSWGSPSAPTAGFDASKIPDGLDMTMNPEYVPEDSVRVYQDKEYGGAFGDYSDGMNDLGSDLANNVSSVRIDDGMDAALFNKQGCDPSYWSLPIKSNVPSLESVGSKYNNNAACIIVLPRGLKNGEHISVAGTVYKIENYRKRKYSTYAYESWGKPAAKDIAKEIADKVPDGSEMSVNQDYDPPIPDDKYARLYRDDGYKGGFVDLGWGMYNLKLLKTNNDKDIANAVSSVKVKDTARVVIFNKDNCNPSYWSKVIENATSALSVLGSNIDNNAACTIVVPREFKDGVNFQKNQVIYKLENYRKRKYPSNAIYESWGRPATFSTMFDIAQIPDGPDMEMNPNYVPVDSVRLYQDKDYGGKYGDYTIGMNDLSSDLMNDASSVRVSPTINAALFNKQGCDISAWNLPVKGEIPSLEAIGSNYNNNAACIVVLPKGINEGDTINVGGTMYKIENFHKRKYSAYAYESWGKPTAKSLDSTAASKIPDGPDMTVNDSYDPPIPAGKYARLYRDEGYKGGFVDLGWGMYNLKLLKTNNGLDIANQVSSVKANAGVRVVLFNKDDCDPSYWSKLIDNATSALKVFGDKYDNNAACAIVVPSIIKDGIVIRAPNMSIYKVENYRKRLYPSNDVYVSWYSPGFTQVDSTAINSLPDGPNIPYNQAYIPPVPSESVRLYVDKDYVGKYVDLSYGQHDLPDGITNDVSSVKRNGVDVALFNKKGCDPSYWSLPVTQDTPSLEAVGSKYNNNAACAIVMPTGLTNGMTVKCIEKPEVYKIENYRKRWYPSGDIYKSWGSPAPKIVTCKALDAIPRGQDMGYNASSVLAPSTGVVSNVPPVEFWTGFNYSGEVLKLGTSGGTLIKFNLKNYTPNIANKTRSIRIPSGYGYKVVVYKSDDFSGTPMTYTASIGSLEGTGFKDDIASVIISGGAPPVPRTYDFYPTFDSYGNDIKQAAAYAGNVGALKSECDKTPSCVGFTTSGWLKNKILDGSSWNVFTSDKNQGLYVVNTYNVNVALPPGITNGMTVKCPNRGEIYRIENNAKRWYPNWDIYASWGATTPTIIDCAVLDKIIRGPDMQAHDDSSYGLTK
jgi:hypothetical protein